MQELSLLEVLSNTLTVLVNSNIFILIVMEIAILILGLSFSKIMNSKLVLKSTIFASLLIVVFYGINYIDTINIFINNLSVRLVEFIYFPSTLEYLIVIVTSFVIMLTTVLNKKKGTLIKIVNVTVPVIISFLLLCIIEYINTNGIPFNEYAIYTNPILASLNEIALGLYVTWLICLFIYKIDKIIINNMNSKNIVEHKEHVQEIKEVSIKDDVIDTLDDDEIELPKLKSSLL